MKESAVHDYTGMMDMIMKSQDSSQKNCEIHWFDKVWDDTQLPWHHLTLLKMNTLSLPSGYKLLRARIVSVPTFDSSVTIHSVLCISWVLNKYILTSWGRQEKKNKQTNTWIVGCRKSLSGNPRVETPWETSGSLWKCEICLMEVRAPRNLPHFLCPGCPVPL